MKPSQRAIQKKETSTQRNRRLQKSKIRYKASLINKTQEDIKNKRKQNLEQESSDERAKRLKHMQDRYALETESERNERLKEKREFDRKKRILVKSSILNFENEINIFCDRICEICTKRCYPKQIFMCTPNKAAQNYLPLTLRKSTLSLCNRCKNHITSCKKFAPSRAYWNNLDPGAIPNVILNLSQVERRLLSRIIPFIKIIKYDGIFGQYGFKGQAILFAQDIFEVSKKLPNMLPRSAKDSDVLVITEHLENLNITREFSVSKNNLYAALRWLISNNPLYKDVLINFNLDICDQSFVKIIGKEIELENTISASNDNIKLEPKFCYLPINNDSRIIRASWNQANDEIFTSGYAGVQCCTMVLANIIRAVILPPNKWTKNILDINLLEGDECYQNVRTLSEQTAGAHLIGEDGYLAVHHFDVIKNEIVMYDQLFSIEYEDDPLLYGSLTDSVNFPPAKPLLEALKTLFENHNSGILIASGRSLGVMHYDHKYYFTDSHSCGPKGASAANGKACIIECDNINELHRICKRSTKSNNIQYTLDYVDVQLRNNVVNEHPVNTLQNNSIENQKQLTATQASNIWQVKSIPIQTSVPTNIDFAQPDVEEELEIGQHLNDIVRKSNNIQYTLDYVDVQLRNNAVVNEHPVNTFQNDSIENQKQLTTTQTNNISQVKSIPIQTSVLTNIDFAQPDVEEELEIGQHLNDIVRKTNDNIVNESTELKSEEYAWWYLFPYGINGFKEKRTIHITPLDYFQYRILGSDTRFESNDYLFYALSMFEYYKVKTNIAACGKKIEGEDGMIDDVHLYLQNLRGSSAYWRKALNELIAQIRCLGPPTYFVTLSCNDLNWIDMKKALLIANKEFDKDPNELDLYTTQLLIEKYPVVVCRHFMIRVEAIMKLITNNIEIFGGRVCDYWWRIEFQNRGSPHLHMVVWIENYPSFDSAEGIALINKVCCCKMPAENDELYDLVKKCQVHHHTSTCTKNDSIICRFNFPRQVTNKTRIVAHSSDDFIKNGGRICLLERRIEDKWVNNYNEILLKIWKGNMDIQPCGSNEAIAFYIAKYISKSEPIQLESSIAQSIRQIQREESTISKKLFKICMRIMKERQVSACECAFRLTHLRMRQSSRKCIFLNTRKPGQRYKVLKFDDNGRATGYCNNIFERYEKRPQTPNFNKMCLLEFAMLFEPFYKKQEDQFDEDDYNDDEHLQKKKKELITLLDNSKMLVRNFPAVVRVPYFTSSTNSENYYYSLLQQYMPYRNENELIGNYRNATEAFKARENEIKLINQNLEIYRARDKQLENAFQQIHAYQILEEQDQLFNELEIDEEEQDIAFEQMSEQEFLNTQKLMNKGQRELFLKITTTIRNQQETNNFLQELLFITGGAGTGKTFMFNLLKNQVNYCYGRPSIKVAALTGVAAKLVGGVTLHTLLKLPVQKDGKIINMPLLTGNYLKIMRQQWTNIKFLFIDEVSMIPYEMLCMIDSRLKQLKNNNEIFGNINILLFGDLMQLPPVRGHQIFNQPVSYQPAVHLWRLFTLFELEVNMRQQSDTTYTSILNALRCGELNQNHIKELEKRVVISADGEFALNKALRIYPTNKQVEEHNNLVLNFYKNQNVKMYLITAHDIIVDATRQLDNVDLDKVIPNDVNKTGGFPKHLKIFIGAKVMLRTNIDVTKGLVNGAIGEIEDIIWPYFRKDQMYDNDIPSVKINFGRDGTQVITPKSIQFQAKYSYGTIERRMLPLILSWASTVHKMQGSTVEHAVVYLGPKLFANGQAYVALSRVKTLKGLKIEELDCSKLCGKKPCNLEAINEMNRLKDQSCT